MGANRHKGTGDFSKGGMCVEVRNNDVNRAMRKLKKLVNQEGIIKEIRDRQYFVTPSEKRRKAKAQGRKRWLKKRAQLEQQFVREERNQFRKNKNKRNQRNVQRPHKGSNQQNRPRPSGNKNFRKPRT